VTGKSVTLWPSAGQRGRPKKLSTALMLVLTAVLLPLLFPPFYCFFLAPVALVPWCVCILRRPMRWQYVGAYYLLGAGFFVPNLFWLGPVTIGGYIALALYMAIYFPIFAWVLHRLVVHLRLPATVAVPLAWLAVEYVRASFVQGGFPWFLLGNCLAPWALLIQTADLLGVWGLTFLVAMLNGFVVDVLRLPLRQGGTFNPVIGRLVALVAVAVAFQVGYGVYRLGEKTTRPGPRVAVMQENFEQRVKDNPENAGTVLRRHLALAYGAAALRPTPDLIVWPETMVTSFVNKEFMQAPVEAFKHFGANAETVAINKQNGIDTRKALQELCDLYGLTQLIGYGAIDPRGSWSASIKQNRTGLMVPGGGAEIVQEYAKVHLVPFGEYIPFRSMPLFGKYMIYLSPYGVDYSNTPGDRWTRFVMKVPGIRAAASGPGTLPNASSPPPTAAEYTFGTPICFEDTMPYPARLMTAARPGAAPGSPESRKADFLLNVSNDGWFHWVELEQRMQASQLRAVENRVAIGRAVNTGNSGFIDTNGRIMGLVKGKNGSSIGAVGTLAMEVPIDSRVTVYSRLGDLLPIVCGIVTTLLVGWTLVRPRRGHRPVEESSTHPAS
jgi:apolipoprotein N-acyltransferase